MNRTAHAARAMRHLLVSLGVAFCAAGCDGGGTGPTSSAPTAISTAMPATTPMSPRYTLSGVVSELASTGVAPIAGARVTDEHSGLTSVTALSGRYSIVGLSPTIHSVSVIVQGYITDTRTVAMTGDTQLDIQLERAATYVLSGIVFEMTAAGQVPLEGVEIYCDSCGSPVGHTWVYTDANGLYRLAWSPNGVHPLFVTKAGYEISDPSGRLRDQYGRITATVNGDTRFDIELARR